MDNYLVYIINRKHNQNNFEEEKQVAALKLPNMKFYYKHYNKHT